MELKNEFNIWALAIVLVSAIAALLLFGIVGARLVLGAFVFFFIPFYLILDNFELTQQEKAIFSIFLGITFLPSLVFWLGFIVPFRASLIISFVIFVGIGFLIKKFKRSGKNNSLSQ